MQKAADEHRVLNAIDDSRPSRGGVFFYPILTPPGLRGAPPFEKDFQWLGQEKTDS